MSKRETSDYYVTSGHCYGMCDDLQEAENYARKQAWSAGDDYFIFKKFAVAEAPAEINTVQISQV